VRQIVFFVTLLVLYFSYRIGAGLDIASVTRLPVVPAGLSSGADTVSDAEQQVPAFQQDERAWQEMGEALNKEAARYPSRLGIYLKDLKTGRTWTYHPDDLFPSASLIKVPIMASVFEKIRSGDISLDTQLVLRRYDRFGGSGSLKWCRDGTSLSVREVLEKMITESDNTAMKMLIDRVGIYALQQQFSKLGLTYTQIYPEGLSLRGGRVVYENFTTPREMAYLLEKMYKRELVDKFSSETMVDIMKRNRSTSRLAKKLPEGWELGHKTGLLRRSCHDVGIVFSPKGDYIIAVLTGKVGDYKTAKNFIAKIGKITFDYYSTDNSMLVQGTPAVKDGKS